MYIVQAAGGVRLLLIDNVAAFHALDRATQPLPAHIVDPDTDAQLGLQQAQGCIVAELQALAQRHRLAVLATRQSGAPASAGFDRRAPVWHPVLVPWQHCHMLMSMHPARRVAMLMHAGGALMQLSCHTVSTEAG